MSYRIIIVFFLILLTTGCATNLKREVHQLEDDLSTSQEKISEAKKSLNNNPDVYNGYSCITPHRGPEPKFSCHTQKESNEKALAGCAISYKGCDAVLAAFGDKLDDKSERFLASQTCKMLVAEMQGESRSAEAVVVDGVTTYAKDRRKNGGFFGKFLGCSWAISSEIHKFSVFSSCVENKSIACYKNYQDWFNGPTNRKNKCEENLATINREEDKIPYLSRTLRDKKSTFMWKLFGDR